MNFKIKLSIWASCALVTFSSFAQEAENNFEIYGYMMTDAGYNFNAIDPDWFDVMRPTKLPKYKNQYGPEGNYFISIRQTRLGFRSSTKTKLGELKTQFDFDFFSQLSECIDNVNGGLPHILSKSKKNQNQTAFSARRA